MTPLAQHLLNDWCQPKAKRTVDDAANVLRLLPQAKCFETTSLELFRRQADFKASAQDLIESGRVFAPAPVTLLDAKPSHGAYRVGALLVERGDWIDYFVLSTDRTLKAMSLNIRDIDKSVLPGILSLEEEIQQGTLLIADLFLINTPHIVGQKVHQPHAGLQRKIARAKGMVGKFPLHAWTEITLWCDADDMREAASDEAIEARFSGRKCLHFVRSFLRWRQGQLERVKAHWRGDPALGMKRSRYLAKPRV
jgi:hypothetical protein